MKALVVSVSRRIGGTTEVVFTEGEMTQNLEDQVGKEERLHNLLWSEREGEEVKLGSWTRMLSGRCLGMREMNIIAIDGFRGENPKENAPRIVLVETPKGIKAKDWEDLVERERYKKLCTHYGLKEHKITWRTGVECWTETSKGLMDIWRELEKTGVWKARFKNN